MFEVIESELKGKKYDVVVLVVVVSDFWVKNKVDVKIKSG